MTRTLKFSATAEQDLRKLYDFGCQSFGLRQARKYTSQLYQAIDKRLADPETTTRQEPKMTQYLHLDNSQVRSFLHQRHRCYFTYDDSYLFVFAILHTSRSQEKIFQRFTETFPKTLLT